MFWLSFADGALPKGSQFLGACIVKADDMISATILAHQLKINPGGEVVGHPIPANLHHMIEPRYVGRLMTRDECAAFDVELKARIDAEPS